MAKSLNRCEFIGNLTKDVDLRYLPSGSAVANFSIACNDSYKNKETGEKVETTEFVNAVAFNKLGEIVGKYLQKGSKVFIEGKMKTDKYEKDGQTRYSTKIVINNMVMLSSKAISQEASDNHPSVQRSNEVGNDDFDDEIPF